MGQTIHLKNGIEYFMPKDSLVQFDSPGKYPSDANFKGQFVLTGTYHYGYSDDLAAPSADPNDLSYIELYFIPDKEVSEKLPYWSADKSVHEIRFTNESEFINTVIPKEDLVKLQTKNYFHFLGMHLFG